MDPLSRIYDGLDPDEDAPIDLHSWALARGREIPTAPMILRLEAMNEDSRGMRQREQAPLPDLVQLTERARTRAQVALGLAPAPPAPVPAPAPAQGYPVLVSISLDEPRAGIVARLLDRLRG